MVDRRHYWLVKVLSVLFGWASWLTMAPLLHQWYSVLSLVILDADEDWFFFACYEDVLFLEYVDTLLHED